MIKQVVMKQRVMKNLEIIMKEAKKHAIENRIIKKQKTTKMK